MIFIIVGALFIFKPFCNILVEVCSNTILCISADVCEKGDWAKGAVKCAALARRVSRVVRSSPSHLMQQSQLFFSWTGNQQVREGRLERPESLLVMS